MLQGNLGLAHRSISRVFLITAVAGLVALWSTIAGATITQGDFSIFGTLNSRWSGRWGEGGAKGKIQSPTIAAREGGGSFDFNRWDLVQARQVADLRPDYHIVKNYNFLGRLDTIFVKDADLFAIYRPWYDAFSDLKHQGIAQKGKDFPNFRRTQRHQDFTRNDLREFYAQVNFTDNFSARIGKQQVIWSEADALSGSDITNPNDLRFHWTHFESPEDLRRNIRMVKFNYILPDFLQTANNEWDGFWIPGDWQGPETIVNTGARGFARDPYVVRAPTSAAVQFNQFLQPVRTAHFADATFARAVPCPAGLAAFGACGSGSVTDLNVITHRSRQSNTTDNSEFGTRYSTLLPIGNGLQMSLIYLYVARSDKVGLDVNQPNGCDGGHGPGTPVLPFPGVNNPCGLKIGAGTFFVKGVSDFGPPSAFGSPLTAGGTIRVFLREEVVRSHFMSITGTYYDKDFTDVVFRYDFSYRPKFAVFQDRGNKAGAKPGTAGSKWTEQTRWIVAADRPTYIPWISKQHTFLVAQYVATWFPDRPSHAVANIANVQGKLREVSNFFFLASTNWLMNGQWITGNVFAWDVDNNVGNLSSTNTYRYSRNILFAGNMIWYLGRSSRFTDPFVFSGNQRINELEFRFTYEI